MADGHDNDDGRSDLMMTVGIELERMFTVLSNTYHKQYSDKYEPMLKEIEAKLKESLNQLGQN